MAQLIAPFRIRGSFDDASFYQDVNGKCIIRKRRMSTAHAFHNNPRYERCRENASEFTNASQAASTIRRAFMSHKTYLTDSNYYNRLVGLMRLITETDTGAPRGARNSFDGNIHLLEDFSFNRNRSLTDAVSTDFHTHIDHQAGLMSFDLNFSPLAHITAPATARYCQFIIKGFGLKSHKEIAAEEVSPLFSLSDSNAVSVSLSVQVGSTQDDTLMLAAGIIFYEDYMGVPVPMRGGALDILAVEETPVADAADPGSTKAAGKDAHSLASVFDSAAATVINVKYLSVPGPIGGAAIFPGYEERLRKLKLQLWLNKLRKYRKG